MFEDGDVKGETGGGEGGKTEVCEAATKNDLKRNIWLRGVDRMRSKKEVKKNSKRSVLFLKGNNKR